MKRSSVFALLYLATLLLLQSNATAEVVVGPGVQPIINAYTTDHFHLVSGTKISSPSVSGPPTTQFQVAEAINFDGGGSVRFDGGEYHGGSASFSGPPATFTTVSAGVAVRLNSFSAEIYGGTFQGGAAFSTATSTAAGGSALVATLSDVKIYGGSFVGGNVVQPNAPYMPSNYPVSAPDIVLRASTGHLYGGDASYIALLNGSILNVYGKNFSQVGDIGLYGNFADGTPINLTIFNGGQGSQLVLHDLVPEPPLTTLLAVGGVLVALQRRMICNTRPHCS